MKDDELGPRLMAGLFFALVLLAVLLLVTGPEPCVDGSGTTACAATTHREEP